MNQNKKEVIITAASEKYANSLFCLIGSLNCNWPSHPELIIYDLGLSEKTLEILKRNGLEIRNIEPFCDHWRKHYTWKLWCMNNIEAESVIWMDAGICILQPLKNILKTIEERDYFVVPNYQFLDQEASAEACEACDVEEGFKIGKGSLAGTLIGYKKESRFFFEVIRKAFELSLNENVIMAHKIEHKHDQALLSILLYKNFPNPIFKDGIKYLGWKSPRMVANQKIWLQRRNIHHSDISHFKNFLSKNGPQHTPKDPKVDISHYEKYKNKLFFKIKVFLAKIMKKNKNNGLR